MNIKSIHSYNALLTKGSVRDYEGASKGYVLSDETGTSAQVPTKKKSAGVCGEKQENIAIKSGSFTRKSETAALSFGGGGEPFAKGLFGKIGRSNWFNKALKEMQEHQIAASAGMSLIFASILRPVTLISLPDRKGSKNDKTDKIYASCHSISSGVMGFVASVVLTTPLDQGLKRIQAALENEKLSPEELIKKAKETGKPQQTLADYGATSLKGLSKETRKALYTIVKNMPEWFIAVPRAALTIMLIPPILKYVFGIEKKKAKPEVQSTIQSGGQKK